jgi:hypothetical protein
MKAHWGNGSIAPSILNLCNGGRCVTGFTIQLPHLQVEPPYHKQEAGKTTKLLWALWKQETLLPITWSNIYLRSLISPKI